MAVIISNRQKRVRVRSGELKKSLGGMLGVLGLSDRELSLVLTDNRGIAALHERFLGKKGPTNVMSFSDDVGGTIPENPLGDVVISVETAGKEARGAGVSLSERLLALAVHGLLHLLGYTHEKSRREARRMEEMEKKLLAIAGGKSPHNPPIIPPLEKGERGGLKRRTE